MWVVASEPPSLGRLRESLKQDAWVSSRDPEQGEGGAFRAAPALLPVPKGVDADAERIREHLLGHP